MIHWFFYLTFFYLKTQTILFKKNDLADFNLLRKDVNICSKNMQSAWNLGRHTDVQQLMELFSCFVICIYQDISNVCVLFVREDYIF